MYVCMYVRKQCVEGGPTYVYIQLMGGKSLRVLGFEE